jgi:hypothetical protein
VGKVEITIRCARCDQVETVIVEAWAAVKTTCGCNGPWRVLERRRLPDEAAPAPPPAPQPDPTG